MICKKSSYLKLIKKANHTLFFTVDSEINCMADVNDLFCDKHTFLPCLEPEV